MEIVKKENSVKFILEKKFFEQKAVFNATYKFLSLYHVDMSPSAEGNNVIVLIENKGSEPFDIEDISKSFHDEVIDQQIRCDLDKQFGNIRDIIVKHAFAPISNLDQAIKGLR